MEGLVPTVIVLANPAVLGRNARHVIVYILYIQSSYFHRFMKFYHVTRNVYICCHLPLGQKTGKSEGEDCCREKGVPDVCFGFCRKEKNVGSRVVTGTCDKWLETIGKCRGGNSNNQMHPNSRNNDIVYPLKINIINISCIDHLPSQPGKPKIEGVGENHCDLSWKIPDRKGATAIKEYKIEYKVIERIHHAAWCNALN